MIAISKTCLKSLQNKNIWILTGRCHLKLSIWSCDSPDFLITPGIRILGTGADTLISVQASYFEGFQASGGLSSPGSPLAWLFPGPAGDLKRSPDPSPTFVLPNTKSWVRPWFQYLNLPEAPWFWVFRKLFRQQFWSILWMWWSVLKRMNLLQKVSNSF
jgi:hypothetical protein